MMYEKEFLLLELFIFLYYKSSLIDIESLKSSYASLCFSFNSKTYYYSIMNNQDRQSRNCSFVKAFLSFVSLRYDTNGENAYLLTMTTFRNPHRSVSLLPTSVSRPSGAHSHDQYKRDQCIQGASVAQFHSLVSSAILAPSLRRRYVDDRTCSKWKSAVLFQWLVTMPFPSFPVQYLIPVPRSSVPH